jgi:hypothetical protein
VRVNERFEWREPPLSNAEKWRAAFLTLVWLLVLALLFHWAHV